MNMGVVRIYTLDSNPSQAPLSHATRPQCTDSHDTQLKLRKRVEDKLNGNSKARSAQSLVYGVRRPLYGGGS